MQARAAIALVGCAFVSVHAATFTVLNNNDSGAGSLRSAITLANTSPPPNTINFDSAVTGSIVLTTGQIHVAGPMSIVGPGATVLKIDGNANDRILSIYTTDPACPALDGPDYLVSISGLRFSNGRRSGSNAAGAIFTEHSLALDSVTIDNSVAGAGGGVAFATQYSGQSLSINNAQFLNNTGQPLSGAADAFGGALAVYEKCSTHTTPVTVSISNSIFSGNQVAPTTLSAIGGAIASDSSADITIADTRIVNNGISVPTSPMGDQVYDGGGVGGLAKSLTITRSEISGNTFAGPAGAHVTRAGGILLTNRASDLQGAGDAFIVTIIDSTISNNAASATAGGILVVGNVSLELDNSTVNGNSAPLGEAGGILISTDATIPPSASTADVPTLTISSSIVANSSSGVDIATDATVGPFSIFASNSLLESVCQVTCNVTVSGAGNLFGVDPMLGPLAFNGGPTQTHALVAGGPAIDAGSNPLALTTDQRGPGYARVIGAAADIGAYEFNPVPAPTLQSAVSRRVHGTAGTFDLPLSLVTPPNLNHNPTTEPRQGPAQTIVFTFDKPVNAATAGVAEGTAAAGAPTFSGNNVIVGFTGVTDQQYVTVALTNVASTDGGTGGSATVRVGFLTGDVNGSRIVAVTDLVVVNNQLGRPLSAANFLSDVNTSGIITVLDKVKVNNALGHFLPAP